MFPGSRKEITSFLFNHEVLQRDGAIAFWTNDIPIKTESAVRLQQVQNQDRQNSHCWYM